MLFFLDTADIDAIRLWTERGILDGVTTNPTHLSKAGGNPLKLVQEICKWLPDGDVSVEVTEKEPEKVYEQAIRIADLAENVAVKIPCHVDYFNVIGRLVGREIRVNVTLVFTLAQALAMAKAGVRYVSPFIGRWDDIDVDGTQLITDIRKAFDMYCFMDTEILAASVRGVRDVHNAILAGADIVTAPPALLEKLFSHPLTRDGIALFDADWKKLGISQFP